MSLYPVTPLPEAKQNTSTQSAQTQAPAPSSNSDGFIDKAKQYLDAVRAGRDSAFRTASFGLLDKGNAALRAALPGQSLEEIEAGKKPLAGNTFSERYHNALNEKSAQAAQDNANHPVATTVGDVAGVTVPMLAGEGIVNAGVRGLESLPAVAKTVQAVKTATSNPLAQKAVGAAVAAAKGAAGVGENAAINAAEEAGQNSNQDVDTSEAAARGAAAGTMTSAPGVATAAGGPVAGGLAAEVQGYLPGALGKAFRALTAGLGAHAVSNDTHNQDMTPDQSQKQAAQNPTDYSDSSNETDDGTPSPDVPQVKIVDGKKFLVTPSGENVPLN